MPSGGAEQGEGGEGGEAEAALWARLAAAEEGLRRTQPSAEELRAEAQRAEELAKEHGQAPKTGGVVKGLARRFSEFLELHGEAYGYQATEGPSIELAIKFQVRE